MIFEIKEDKLVGYVARMIQMKNSYRIPGGKIEGKSNLGDLSIDVKIILKWSLKKYSVGVCNWIRLSLVRSQWRVLVFTVMNLRVL
jgi:hypothetical protein